MESREPFGRVSEAATPGAPARTQAVSEAVGEATDTAGDPSVEDRSRTAGEGSSAPGVRRRPGGGARGRRRRRVTGGRQGGEHRVKVTEDEEERLVERASAEGVSVARLLVESALAAQGETPSQRQELVGDLLSIQHLLGTIANNVNQIARATNATLEYQPETPAALDVVRRVCERIDATLDQVGGR